MRNVILIVALFALSISGYSQNENGRLLFDGVYTQNGKYVVFVMNQQEWKFDGLQLLTTFNIYERCLYHNDKSYPYMGNETCLGVQCRRYGSNNDDYYLVDNNGNVKWSFSISMSVPIFGNIRTTSLTFFDYGNWITNPILNDGFSSPSVPTTPSSTSYNNSNSTNQEEFIGYRTAFGLSKAYGNVITHSRSFAVYKDRGGYFVFDSEYSVKVKKHFISNNYYTYFDHVVNHYNYTYLEHTTDILWFFKL